MKPPTTPPKGGLHAGRVGQGGVGDVAESVVGVVNVVGLETKQENTKKTDYHCNYNTALKVPDRRGERGFAADRG